MIILDWLVTGQLLFYVFRLPPAVFMGHMATWRGKGKVWLRRVNESWCNMLHGYMHAASLHDTRGPQVSHRGNGQLVFALFYLYLYFDL